MRRGFLIVELLVAALLAALLARGLWGLYRLSSHSTRKVSAEVEVAQGHRALQSEIALALRNAGVGIRGGDASGLALSTDNNVSEGTRIGGAGTPRILGGSDVLRLRGSFESVPLEVAQAVLDGGPSRYLILAPLARNGASQNLADWADELEQAADEALIVQGSDQSGGCAVLQVETLRWLDSGDPETSRLEVTVASTASGVAEDYARLTEACGPLDFDLVDRVAILEEWRYYVRHEIRLDGSADLRLAKARFYPGSTRLHPSTPSGALDIVDGVTDFQVALAVDVDRDGWSGEDSADDIWIGSEAGDRDLVPWQFGRLRAVRVSARVEATVGLPGFVPPRSVALEDRAEREVSESDPVESRSPARVLSFTAAWRG